MTAEHETDCAHLALSAHPVATLVVDLDGGVEYSNRAARRLFGLPKVQRDQGGSIADWELRRMSLGALLQSAAASSNWVPLILLRGKTTVHARARGLRPGTKGQARVLITAGADATTPFLLHARQIKKLNAQLAVYQRTARELRTAMGVSNTLKRELVHRVKNNLAIISALLNQQARATADGIVADELKTAASRIQSIAIVHDILDASDRTEHVDLAEMFRMLAASLDDALCPPHVAVRAEVQPVTVHIDTALPLALLINELVTNAIKHAFKDRESGLTRLVFEADEDQVRVRVADNGIGTPLGDGGQVRVPRMIAALTRQIGGSITAETTAGTDWRLSFPNGDVAAFASVV